MSVYVIIMTTTTNATAAAASCDSAGMRCQGHGQGCEVVNGFGLDDCARVRRALSWLAH